MPKADEDALRELRALAMSALGPQGTDFLEQLAQLSETDVMQITGPGAPEEADALTETDVMQLRMAHALRNKLGANDNNSLEPNALRGVSAVADLLAVLVALTSFLAAYRALEQKPKVLSALTSLDGERPQELLATLVRLVKKDGFVDRAGEDS